MSSASITTARGRSAVGRGVRRGDLIAAAPVVAALAFAYAPSLARLARLWASDANANYGYLVLPIALYILWDRRGRLDRDAVRPDRRGWPLLAGLLVLRAWLYQRNEQWMEAATLPPVLAALALAFGGRALLRWALPAIAFCLFLLPLPPSVSLVLARPLQTLATLGSAGLLQGMGLPVLSRGHVLFIGDHQLEVARACNGLSMLVSFVALIAATVLLIDAPRWQRAVLLVGAVPIALISNVLRIAATAWAYRQFGPQATVRYGWGSMTVEQFGHDAAGWAMMPVALLLVALELKLMSWLVVEEEVEARAMVRSLSPAAPNKPR